jgi:prevent-host-death family protein
MQVSVVELRANISDAINRAAYGGERIILQRRGKPVAAIVSLDDVAALEALEDDIDLRLAVLARKEKGAVSLDQVKSRLGMS